MKKLLFLILTGCSLFVLTSVNNCKTKIQPTQPNVVIDNYHNGDSICLRPKPRINIKTTIPDNQIQNIYLLVHPTAVDNYYVQPALTNDMNGNWHVTPYIGQDNDSNNGEDFDIIVVVNTNPPLAVRQVLGAVPKAAFQSAPVNVIKKRCAGQ